MPSHKVLKLPTPQPGLQTTLSKACGISTLLAQLLINRGIKQPHDAEAFLKPAGKLFHDPFSFIQMRAAVHRIEQAISAKQRIMIFGDYDVDGITSLALLKGTLAKRGADIVHYLPHRIKDGYGLKSDIAAVAKQQGVALLITVDCGISNHTEIKQLRAAGVDVIITDHHEPSSDELPDASSIINPKVKRCGYPFRDLAGVGVAYKLCQAIRGDQFLDGIELTCVGTIADSAPLVGENRAIVREGLARLEKTGNIGLRVMMENAGIKNRKLNTTFVNFIIGPRINASGRMDTPETSLQLLMSSTEEQAQEYAQVLEAHNRQRQKIEGRILDEAEAMINRDINFKEHKIIVIAKEDWHQGVLGIVASKLADRFLRPAIVISVSDTMCRGSARSIKSFHMFDALLDCKKFLNSFGGHSHAAGLSIAKDSIEEFRTHINRLAHERMSLEDLLPSLDVDMELGLGELNADVINELAWLEPHGQGNPEPLFYTRHLRLKGVPETLKRETLKFWVTDGKVTHQAIGFGMSSLRDSLVQAQTFDIVYSPRIDSWRGEEEVLLEVKDIFFK